jgi:hypothetical protein
MTVDHKISGTCAPALVRDYLSSTQINGNPQGLALRLAASVFTAKNGSGTSNKRRGRTQLRSGLWSSPASFGPTAHSERRIIAASIP